MEPKILIILIVIVLVLIFKFKNNFGNISLSAPMVSKEAKLTPSEIAIKASQESVNLQQNLVDALQQQIKNINKLDIHAPEMLSQTKATLISAQDQLKSSQNHLMELTKNKKV